MYQPDMTPDEMEERIDALERVIWKFLYAHELGGSVTVVSANPITREQQWWNAKAEAVKAGYEILGRKP